MVENCRNSSSSKRTISTSPIPPGLETIDFTLLQKLGFRYFRDSSYRFAFDDFGPLLNNLERFYGSFGACNVPIETSIVDLTEPNGSITSAICGFIEKRHEVSYKRLRPV